MFSKHFNFCQRWPLWGFENCPDSNPNLPYTSFRKTLSRQKSYWKQKSFYQMTFCKKRNFFIPTQNKFHNRCIEFHEKQMHCIQFKVKVFPMMPDEQWEKKNHFLIKLNHISHFKSSISNFKLTPFVIIYVFSCAHPLSFCFSVYC